MDAQQRNNTRTGADQTWYRRCLERSGLARPAHGGGGGDRVVITTGKPFIGFMETSDDPDELDTRPMPLDDLPRQARIDREMAIIRSHHERIFQAIQLFWGHKDCAQYLKGLVLNGAEGRGEARIGFKREVLSSLINLLTMHEHEQA